MRKLIQFLQFESRLSCSLSQNYHANASRLLLSLLTSSTSSHYRACSSTPNPSAKDSVLTKFLIGSLKFSKDKALSISSRYSHIESLEKPEEAVRFFKDLGLSDTQIQSVAHAVPQFLFSDIEETLRPKVVFFQEQGLSGPSVCDLISRNPGIFKSSLDGALKPYIDLIKKVLKSDERKRTKKQLHNDLLRILRRCDKIAPIHVEANILYLESCGVIGAQLSSLLTRQTRIFTMPKEKLEGLVSRAVEMNFKMGSRMLAHGIQCLSCMSVEGLNGKFEVLTMLGFSKDEIASTFSKSPHVFKLSEAKLRSKVEFFLNELKIEKVLILRNPTLLILSLEERVIPRCKVLEILKAKRLLRKDPSFTRAMIISNQQFQEEFVEPFEFDLRIRHTSKK